MAGAWAGFLPHLAVVELALARTPREPPPFRAIPGGNRLIAVHDRPEGDLYSKKVCSYPLRRTLTEFAWAWSPSASAIVSTASPMASSPSRVIIWTVERRQKWFTSSPEYKLA